MNIKNPALVILGAIGGGLAGYVLFFQIVKFGFYGLIIPGGLLGMGAGAFKNDSKAIAIICGVMALLLGLFTEWRFAPFRADPSLGYFLTHIHKLNRITLIMIAVGAGMGFWVPFRRSQEGPNQQRVE
jgi:hypothetical protein